MKTHSDELTLFVAVVEAGSFRQAAENLGMDNSVVSRGIKRLEEGSPPCSSTAPRGGSA